MLVLPGGFVLLHPFGRAPVYVVEASSLVGSSSTSKISTAVVRANAEVPRAAVKCAHVGPCHVCTHSRISTAALMGLCPPLMHE